MLFSSILSVAVVASAGAMAAESAAPFVIEYMTSHQPTGNPDGQVNYYHVDFNLSSSSKDGAPVNCWATWGDNSYSQQEAYSVNVPTGSWIPCQGSDQHFAFQLYPYFSIGNFSLGLLENYTDSTGTAMTATTTTHVTNTTSAYACDITASEVEYVQHAHGDCSMAANASVVTVPAADVVPATACTKNVNATFMAAYPTKWGQTILLTGSLPQLGSWNAKKAIKMKGSSPSPPPAWPIFTAYVDIEPGVDFEYRYIFVNTTGKRTEEYGDNRYDTTPSYACNGNYLVGQDPDDVRIE
ncbi:hypothetical protein AAFC00_003299 [Neodothiora populina]|uniref:CBM20 domain-containing protein n=1 Tax=Neodothiora populina TaxID=2781224 RepID=A0ABR3PA09_9PEZI